MWKIVLAIWGSTAIAISVAIYYTHEQIIATKTLEESGALQKIQTLRGFHMDFNRYAKKHNISPVKDNKYSEDYLEKREVFQAGAEAYREAVLYILTSKQKGRNPNE